jgi:predicted unusual protein kinase regulating ubiquinone biosynthesis (AarF/ABC1/UbiB family)
MYNECVFLCKVAWIFTSETIIYCFTRDYKRFVDNLSLRLATINILYVKVFQAVALNSSFIDENTNNRLLKYTDNAPWSDKDVDMHLLHQVASENGLIIKEEYEHPINSGMISIVFKLFQQNTDEPVILKMKRRNIDSTLSEAIANLVFFVNLLNVIPSIKDLEISAIIHNNIDIIKQQTNFEEEVENITMFQEKCKHLKYVKIPKVYPDVTKKYSDCILMEYIEGLKINQINNDDYDHFAKYHIKSVIACGLIHGIVHGDLHGGNILFIKDEADKKYKYKIGIIDYGVVYKFNNDQRSQFFDFITELTSTSAEITAERIIKMGVIEPVEVFINLPKHHYDAILEIITDIIHDTLYVLKRADCKRIFTSVKILNEYLNTNNLKKHGIGPSNGFVIFQLTIAMLYGVIITLCKSDERLLEVFDESITEMFRPDIVQLSD